MTDLMDYQEARKAVDDLATSRRAAEDDHEKQVEKAAAAKRELRREHALAFLKAQGTVAEREQIARRDTANLAFDADLQVGLVGVIRERLEGLEGDRAMLRKMIDWSMREGSGAQPAWTPREAA